MNNTINLYGLLEKSYNLYKENFSNFIQISLAISLIQVIMTSSKKLLGEDLILVYFLLALLLLYFQMKLSITFLYVIKDRYQNINTSIPENYAKSKEKFWRYVGASFLFGLIVGIPFALFYMTFLLTDIFVLKTMIVIVGGSIALFLFMHYFLAPFIVVLDKKSKASFSESFRLVKTYRTTTIFVVLILMILEGAPYLLFKFINLPGIIGLTIEAFVEAIIFPFSLGFILIFYKVLHEKVNDLIQE